MWNMSSKFFSKTNTNKLTTQEDGENRILISIFSSVFHIVVTPRRKCTILFLYVYQNTIIVLIIFRLPWLSPKLKFLLLWVTIIACRGWGAGLKSNPGLPYPYKLRRTLVLMKIVLLFLFSQTMQLERVQMAIAIRKI
jgi:hypothetical protein